VNAFGNDPSRVTDEAREVRALRDYRPGMLGAEVETDWIVWLRLLRSERRSLFRTGLSGLLLSFLVALVFPSSYESQTRLMPPEQQGGSAVILAALAATRGRAGISASSSDRALGESSDGMGTDFLGLKTTGARRGSLGGMATDFLGPKTTGALVVDILSGQTIQDDLIQKFDLRNGYHVRYWQDARQRLETHTSIKEDRKSGVISITVRDRDPHRAQEMAKAYVEALNGLLARVSTSSARRERIFLEERLKSAEKSLDAASQEFSNYASKKAAFDVPSQTKTMVESEAMLEGQLATAESELQELAQTYTNNNVRIHTLRARVAALRQQIENFSGNKGDTDSPQSQIVGDLPSIRKLPLVSIRWLNLYRESKIQEAMYEMLTQEDEYAKIQEAKEIQTINVLDAALVPERNSFPPRAVLVVVGALLSVLLAGVLVIAAATWKRSQSPEKQLAAEIWGQIRAQNARSRAWLHMVCSRFGAGDGKALRDPAQREQPTRNPVTFPLH
jgi:capsule polysaccharide export protein KpsE/RkpR